MQLIKSPVFTQTGTEAGSDNSYSNLEKELMLFAEVHGKQNGINNKPVTEREFRAYFLNTVESKIQGAIDLNQREHLPVSGAVVAQTKQREANAIINPLAASLNEMGLELRTLEERKKQCAPDLRKRKIRQWFNCILAVISVTEGFFAYGAFRRIPMSTIPTLMTSIGIAAAIAVATHTLAGYIAKSKTRQQFRLRFFISAAPLFIGFCMLGNLRARGLNTAAQMDLNVHQNTMGGSGVSGIAISIISFLLFLAALIVAVKYHKTEEETTQDATYDKACAELAACENKMKEIKNTIEKTRNEASEQSAEALGRYEHALAVENRLKSLGKQVMQEYILKNLCYRTDGMTPVFFAEPPALNFRLFFDNLKKDKS